MRITPSSNAIRIYGVPKTLERTSPDIAANTWAVETAYTKGYVVVKTGILYYALQNSTGKTPATEPTYWALLPAMGDGDYGHGTPTANESRRQINSDGTITDFLLGIDYPINPATMDVVNGTGLAIPRGAWDYEVTYVVGDMVSLGGVVYIAKTNVGTNLNKSPDSETDYWGVSTWATDAASPPTFPTFTWPAALVQCKELTWNGSSDWMLPSMLILQQMFTSWEEGDWNINNPIVRVRLFPGLPASGNYWSSTRSPYSPWAYAQRFASGSVQTTQVTFVTASNAYPVRLTSRVRTPAVLSDPYSGVNWDTVIHGKAALHVHTYESFKSVGEASPAKPHEQVDAYKAAGFDILSLTDHNIVAGQEWTTWAAYDEPNGYENRVPATVGLVAIYGNERTDNGASWHHIVMFGDYNTAAAAGVTITTVAGAGGLHRIAHPTWSENFIWSRFHILIYTLTYNGWGGIEIVNSLTLGSVKDPFVEEGRTGADIAVWDKLLTYLMPYRPMWGYCVDDSHILGPNKGEMAEAAYTVILVDELTEAKVKAALTAGQFYGVSGGTPPTLTSVVHDSVNKAITITASGWTGIDWISEGNVVANGNVLHYGFLDSIKSYVRARVKNATGDLWLQPVALNMLH